MGNTKTDHRQETLAKPFGRWDGQEFATGVPAVEEDGFGCLVLEEFGIEDKFGYLVMSAFVGKADINSKFENVRFVPKADISQYIVGQTILIISCCKSVLNTLNLRR